MIESAKNIASSISDVIKESQKIADKCKNMKLKEDLLKIAGVPQVIILFFI